MIRWLESLRKLVSIISAVYNEERTIPIFYDRLQRALAPHRARFDFEIIFTNNASTDATPQIVAALREKDPSVQLVTLSRNFGYQASVQSGLTYAAGDASIVIDADCEDPPEMIPEFLDQWEKGYDVVYGIRQDRPEPWIVKKSRDLFYHVLSISADMEIVLFMAEFALLTAEVRRAILRNETSFPFLRAEIGYAGFNRLGIPYKRQKRVAGQTHYNVSGMIIFATAGILTASTFLLRAAAYTFPVFLLLNVAGWLWDRLNHGGAGFEFAVMADLLYVMAMLAIIGLYVARIYKNGMRRPNFIVNRNSSLLNRPFPATVHSLQSAGE